MELTPLRAANPAASHTLKTRLPKTNNNPAILFGRAAQASKPLESPDDILNLSNTELGKTKSLPKEPNSNPHVALATEILHLIAAEPGNTQLKQEKLLSAIQKGKKLPLPKGYRLEYGIIHPDGHVESPYHRAKALIEPVLRKPGNRPKTPQPVLLTIHTPQTSAALEKFIEHVLKQELSQPYTNPKSGIVTNNIVLSDVIEKLISGHTESGLPEAIKEKVVSHLNGHVAEYDKLARMYKVSTPGNPALAQALNNNSSLRQKLIGLDIAKKVYADSQDIEWHSIALSLALGATGEPLINHMFKDGGTAASVARTGLISGIDIMGNILSVMGVVNENLKDRQKKLSIETLYGPKGKRNFPKDLLSPKGEAGPDIKQGIKVGVLGGMFGMLFNIPAGTILSMPNADVTSRSIVGGLSGIGSAVAIPTVIKDSTESFKASIRTLIEKDKIKLPDSVKGDPAKTEKYIERMALKELNARIGIASSIKATHPLPLAGLGGVILAAEKLGIPRSYVQTSYMALAPVMHNFLRLGYTGTETFWAIPKRMNTLEKLVLASEQEKDQRFTDKQLERMDQAFLSGQEHWLSNGLSKTASVFTLATVLLAAEVLCFADAIRKDKKTQSQPAQSKPTKTEPRSNQPLFDPYHYDFSKAYTVYSPRTSVFPSAPSAPWDQNPFSNRNHPAFSQPYQQVF